ncbi:alkanesulfonate monooxygenase SsuD/methylene tetrahydromethanopterin reductase-like flavin-dependent oxidoreductase (luciferase family) [Microbacterium sp. SORGH_AS428]|uniref:LLM class flavin-dependent oxidoreductase n=1 Tax=Microbacterium sp. SORGH_AS_0428 TaxID=3041788 RepID=UPI00285973C4|nr:LLM class flavin-dependent oxidoreductase [Microbacterium sp. SORGH_AS_0428]MDR6198153.1 alkanesulfonate monooxygenase SsuD/methylene tetrahydromethanopterin reductase-like flavin-dependent oxidoreductase (luciferase family) [Microbacterium sp. SORGH_AS_0428]
MSLFAGFSAAPTWMRGEAWRRPDSRVEELFSGAPIVDAVVMAEAAGFDVAFRPDALTLPVDSVGRDPAHLGLDPIVQTAQLAMATRTIGLIATVSATFTEPYAAARQLVSLEHLAPGRIGWNVVTSRSGDTQFSRSRPPSSSERWRRAEEFIDVVESLRRGFPADAFVVDRAASVLVDIERVRPIDHVGAHFRVAGPLPLPVPSEQTLPLMVAGGGEATVSLAGRRADALFAAAIEAVDAATQRAAIQDAAVAAGRTERPRLLPGISLLLADTREEAAEIERATYPSGGGRRTVGPHWSVVGTASDAVAAIAARARAGVIDGFIAFPVGSWHSVELLCASVMPRLRELGLVAVTPTAHFRPHEVRSSRTEGSE